MTPLQELVFRSSLRDLCVSLLSARPVGSKELLCGRTQSADQHNPPEQPTDPCEQLIAAESSHDSPGYHTLFQPSDGGVGVHMRTDAREH